ncbi:MAG: proline--tRNA ligase [Gammaproteobacteria bacterium]|nr:proline--tRNA ligase [Gammaproteobacteria bacterium]
MTQNKKTALNSTRNSDYTQWYLDVISAADLAEHSSTRGAMILKPWGYALWERCQKILDEAFKKTGHQNVYFPLLIPLKMFAKEAQHIDGFAKECAVVTHHRLSKNADGQLVPDGELEEPYVIRPTSEMIIGEAFSRWVDSYRDLPILINQWANVMRWEMRTRLFLRTSEILWQEGHTAHATAKEAREETLLMLSVYENFIEKTLNIPVITGMKPMIERFPGAEETYTLEVMTQNQKALQAGTSHFMGQNFAKACDIQFTSAAGQKEFAWTTSWGMTTRLIGALIMVHADDCGLVLPAPLAPYHVVILPILKNRDSDAIVLKKAQEIQEEIESLFFEKEPIRVHIDRRDIRGGDKNWQWIKKGVPLRIEIGEKEIEMGTCSLSIRYKDRDPLTRMSYSLSDFYANIQSILADQTRHMWDMAANYRQKALYDVQSYDELKKAIQQQNDSEEKAPGFFSCFLADTPELEAHLKALNVTARCLPMNALAEKGVCIITGQPDSPKMILAKAY